MIRLLDRKQSFIVLQGKVAKKLYGETARYLQTPEGTDTPLLFNCGGRCLEDMADIEADAAQEDAIEAGIQARLNPDADLEKDAADKKESAAAKRRARYAEKKKAELAAKEASKKKAESANAATGGMQGSA